MSFEDSFPLRNRSEHFSFLQVQYKAADPKDMVGLKGIQLVRWKMSILQDFRSHFLIYMYLLELEFSKCCHENFDVILDVFEFLEFCCQFLASFSAKRFDVLPSTSLVGAKPTTSLLQILIF